MLDASPQLHVDHVVNWRRFAEYRIKNLNAACNPQPMSARLFPRNIPTVTRDHCKSCALDPHVPGAKSETEARHRICDHRQDLP